MPVDVCSLRALDIYRNLPFADRRAVDALLGEADIARLKNALALTSLEADAATSRMATGADPQSSLRPKFSDWLEERLAAANDDEVLPGQNLTTATRALLSDLQSERTQLAD